MLSTLRPLRPSRHPPLTRCVRWSSALETVSAVVVGGGAVGCSIAYHLAKKGLKGVVLLEAAAIGSGQTTQPPGFTSYMSPVARYNRLMIDSSHLYEELGSENSLKWERPGTLRLGVSERRLAEFHYYQSKDFTGSSRILTPSEVKDICPFIDENKVQGALFSEGDGFLDSAGLSKTLATAAEALGAKVMEGVEYQGIRRDGSAWEISTTAGPIRSNNVINAAGLRAKSIAAEVGVHLPLVDIVHHFTVIDPPSQLRNHTRPIPAIVDHETNWYIRPYEDAFIFGAFEAVENVKMVGEGGGGAGATPEQRAEAMATMPLLQSGTGEVESEGRLALSPDGLPLIGPVRRAPGYWVAAGFFDGVGTAGGVGKYMADWLLDQEPPFELSETCASRYDDWLTKGHMVERAKESYSMTLNWSVRAEDRTGGRPCSTRISGIYSALRKEGAHMFYRNGWEAAGWFGPDDVESRRESLRKEYEAVVNNVGIIDVSYKGLIEVRGSEREKFLNKVLSFSPPATGFMSEGLMLTPKGRVFSHIMLLHHEKNFLLSCSPEQENRNLRWLETMAYEGDSKWDVEFTKVSAYLSKLKVSGPNSAELLSTLTVANMRDFPYKGARVLRLAGVPSIVIGYCETGEQGFALFHSRAETLKLYGALMREGERLGVANYGFKTQNILRMEKGLPRDESEFCLDFTAQEAGVGHMVEMKKAEFVGKTAMAQAGVGDRSIRLCRLPEEAQVPRGAEVLRCQQTREVVGHVTSGCYSFALNAPLFFAILNSSAISANPQLVVDFGTGETAAEVLDSPPRPVRFK